jgi:hypothetical protein
LTVYTAAGAASSMLVGAALGYLGLSVGTAQAGAAGVAVAIGVATVAAVRELGVAPVPLVQLKRQTPGNWGLFGQTTAAALWGFDLGLFATTWLTFAGAWLVPVLAVVSGSPAFGAVLFGAYWGGRALSVWVAPALMTRATDTVPLMDALMDSRRLVQLVHVAGLAWGIVVLAVMAATSMSV